MEAIIRAATVAKTTRQLRRSPPASTETPARRAVTASAAASSQSGNPANSATPDNGPAPTQAQSDSASAYQRALTKLATEQQQLQSAQSLKMQQ
ncbi:MAG: hypothetical protein RL748_513, partial [Pseudomonadota bacterium]